MMKNKNQSPVEQKEIELTKIGSQPTQLNLLQDITDQVVNTQSLRLWDSLVNAVFDDKKIVNRVAGKFLETTTESIEFEGKTVEIVRYPARIKSANSEKDVFPMKKDYKVLEALIKLAIDESDTAFYKGEGTHLTVRASYYRVYQVFKNVTGKASFSYKQIEESIDILSKAHTDFKFNDMQIKGSLISSFIGTRDEDLKSSEFLITFHPIISRIVMMGSFREANLKRILNTKDMFTSFLYKKFVHNFKQASLKNSYHFSMNKLLKEVPHIEKWKQVTRKIEKVNASLDKLKEDGLILSWDGERRYSEGAGARKTINCFYTVRFTSVFIDEQIKANKKSPDDNRISSDGRMIQYPKRKDFDSNKKYIEELTLWHDLGGDNKSEIIEKVFTSETKK